MLRSTQVLASIAGIVFISAISAYEGATWAMRKSTSVPSAISASQFILVDERGHVGARVTWEKHQPAVELFDSGNHLRSSLFLEPNGVPDIYLYDAKDQVRAALNLFDSGVPNLAFLDETGRFMVWTEYDANGSYNTIFSNTGEMSNREIASRRVTADRLGLHVRDIVSSGKQSK
jgi:hypothetical protein